MTGTIESINNIILSKIQCLNELVKYIGQSNIIIKHDYIKELDSISKTMN